MKIWQLEAGHCCSRAGRAVLSCSADSGRCLRKNALKIWADLRGDETDGHRGFCRGTSTIEAGTVL